MARLAADIAERAVHRLERDPGDGDPAAVTGQRPGQQALALVLGCPGHREPAMPGPGQLGGGEHRCRAGIGAVPDDPAGLVDDLDHVLAGRRAGGGSGRRAVLCGAYRPAWPSWVAELRIDRVQQRRRQRGRRTASCRGRTRSRRPPRTPRPAGAGSTWLRRLCLAEPVTHPPDRLDVMPAERHVDLAAQVVHVLIDDVGRAVVGEVPDGLDDLRTGSARCPGGAGRTRAGRTPWATAAARCSPRQARLLAGSSFRSPTASTAGRRRSSRRAERPQPGGELEQAERLDQVVVGARRPGRGPGRRPRPAR